MSSSRLALVLGLAVLAVPGTALAGPPPANLQPPAGLEAPPVAPAAPSNPQPSSTTTTDTPAQPAPAPAPEPTEVLPPPPSSTTTPPVVGDAASITHTTKVARKAKKAKKAKKHHRRHARKHRGARAHAAQVAPFAAGSMLCDPTGIQFNEPDLAAYTTDIFATDEWAMEQSVLVHWNERTGTPEVVRSGAWVLSVVGSAGPDGTNRWIWDGSAWRGPYSQYQLFPARFGGLTPDSGYYLVYQRAYIVGPGSTGATPFGGFSAEQDTGYQACQI